MLRFVTVLFSLLLASGCTRSLQLQVLEPSLVTSPPDIHSLAVVDRSRARNVGQGILGALEGAVTGEAIGADNEGRSRAMSAVLMGLRDSPRFDAAEAFVPRKELESSLFDKELSWGTAKRICQDANCQGIVSLEAFDSDSDTQVRTEIETDTDDNGNEVKRTVFIASRRTRVTTAWRYYDVVGKQIIDDVRTWDEAHTWTERGGTREAALSALPVQTRAVAYVGELAGASYARRIAPTWVVVTRSWFGGGSPEMKEARDRARAMDWAGAIDIWDGLYRDHPEAKIRGRAAFNLALAAEREGDLQNAAAWATEAAVLLANGRARGYRRTLERRLADQQRLEAQMDLSEPGRVQPERPARPQKPRSPLRQTGGGARSNPGQGNR